MGNQPSSRSCFDDRSMLLESTLSCFQSPPKEPDTILLQDKEEQESSNSRSTRKRRHLQVETPTTRTNNFPSLTDSPSSMDASNDDDSSSRFTNGSLRLYQSYTSGSINRDARFDMDASRCGSTGATVRDDCGSTLGGSTIGSIPEHATANAQPLFREDGGFPELLLSDSNSVA